MDAQDAATGNLYHTLLTAATSELSYVSDTARSVALLLGQRISALNLASSVANDTATQLRGDAATTAVRSELHVPVC